MSYPKYIFPEDNYDALEKWMFGFEHPRLLSLEECAEELTDLQAQLQASREEIDKLKAEVKKKKNRIGILNRSLRRLKKGGE